MILEVKNETQMSKCMSNFLNSCYRFKKVENREKLDMMVKICQIKIDACDVNACIIRLLIKFLTFQRHSKTIISFSDTILTH